MKPHVVIADDQVEVRDMLTGSLRSEGREVMSFPTGSDALAHIIRNMSFVEMAILDLDFGAGQPDGLEILRQIREVSQDLPTIILTGKGSVDTAVSALRMGATDFIEKDFYIEDRLELSLEKLDRITNIPELIIKKDLRFDGCMQATFVVNVFFQNSGA